MRFLVSVFDTQSSSATPTEMADISRFNDGLRAAGQLIMAAGLVAPAETLVFDRAGNQASDFVVRAGTHEFISGFWIVDTVDAESATRLASDAARACARRVELRAFIE